MLRAPDGTAAREDAAGERLRGCLFLQIFAIGVRQYTPVMSWRRGTRGYDYPAAHRVENITRKAAT
jgi:hypothetical protein